MGDVVNIKPIQLHENHEFVSDCCRFQESLLSEVNMKLKWGFADSVWQDLGNNEALLAAVEEEKIKRIRSGRQKRERAQLLVTKAPDVVSSIMLDPAANARHRIDAAASLDKLAANPADNTAAAMGEMFSIVINLGADSDGKPIVERYDKSIAICADDGAPINGSGAPQKAIPWDDGDAAVKTPVKTPIERETSRAKSPQEIALESMMRY